MQASSPFFGIRVQQSWRSIQALSDFVDDLAQHELIFDRIVELGTGKAGLTWLLALYAARHDAVVHSFDIDDSITPGIRYALQRLGVKLYEGSVTDNPHVVTQIQWLIHTTGRVLVICDNGDKSVEFNKYAPCLKEGDYLIVHDYANSEDQFLLSENRNWDWCEITWDDVYETLHEFGLERRYTQLFNDKEWLCVARPSNNVGLLNLEPGSCSTLRCLDPLDELQQRTRLARMGIATLLPKPASGMVTVQKPEIGVDDLVAWLGDKCNISVVYPDILDPSIPERSVAVINQHDNVDLSVVLIAHNQRYLKTEKCLRWLTAAMSKHNAELICVDDGSTDNTSELFSEYADCVVRFDERSGICAAYNSGLMYAKGRCVCFMQNDFAISNGVFEALTDILETHPNVGLAYPRSYSDVLVDNPDIGDLQTIAPGDIWFFPGWCTLGRREFFMDVCGYDEHIYNYGEDFDMAMTAKAFGYEIARDQTALCLPIYPGLGASTVNNPDIYTAVQRARKYASYFYQRLKWGCPIESLDDLNIMFPSDAPR